MSNTNKVPSAEEFVDANKTMPHIEAMKEYTRHYLEAMRDEITSGDEKVILVKDIEKTINNYIENNKL